VTARKSIAFSCEDTAKPDPRQVSNPAGQAIKEKVTIGGFFFYRLIVRIAPPVTARKSIAFSCEDAAKPDPRQVSNPAGQAIKEKVTVGGFFFYRLFVWIAPPATARKSIAFSCEDAAKPDPRQVSNPAGQAIKEKVTVGGFFFYRLIVWIAPHVTARKSIAFSCEDAAKPDPRQVSNPAWQAISCDG